MAKKQLNVKEQHYADTREEAEEIVEEAKEDIYLTSHGIAEKHNKYGQYFLVDLKFNYDTPKEITASPALTEKRGQLSPDLSRWLMGYPAEWGSSI